MKKFLFIKQLIIGFFMRLFGIKTWVIIMESWNREQLWIRGTARDLNEIKKTLEESENN